jgi:hypothetical protein
MSIDAEFEKWWEGVWLKVGKFAAKREYIKARKTVTADALLAGRDAYQRSKPQWQAWAHPRTWLYQGRWLDELPGVRETQATDWFQECQELHHGACGLSRWRHHERKALDAIKSGMGQ